MKTWTEEWLRFLSLALAGSCDWKQVPTRYRGVLAAVSTIWGTALASSVSRAALILSSRSLPSCVW